MCVIYGYYVPKPVIEQFVLRLYGLSPINYLLLYFPLIY